jgi:hypothetical protein
LSWAYWAKVSMRLASRSALSRRTESVLALAVERKRPRS